MRPTIEELILSEQELTKLAHHPKFIGKQEIILRAVNALSFARLEIYRLQERDNSPYRGDTSNETN